MNRITPQHGVGLIEVLVAVLLLSVAVLGFSALQIRAVSATDESLVRTKSLTVVRNISEIMRAYPEAYVIGTGTVFNSAAPTETLETPAEEEGADLIVSNAIPTVQAVISSTATQSVTVDGVVIGVLATANNCLSTGFSTDDDGNKIPNQSCNLNQLAARDALMAKKMAADEDIKMAVVTCPGTTVQAIQRQMCVITAWNDTKAILDDSDTNACATTNGIYKRGNHCLISEAY